jgi:hypothetical protein
MSASKRPTCSSVASKASQTLWPPLSPILKETVLRFESYIFKKSLTTNQKISIHLLCLASKVALENVHSGPVRLTCVTN